MAFCDVMPSQSERFTKDSNVISSKLANDLDSKLTSSSKQVLLQRIEFKAASKPDEQYEKLKNKYKALNQSSVSNGKTEKNCNQVNNGKKHDDRPEPRVVLCTPDNIMLQWNKVRRVGPGLSNLGNTCYLNSVIQVLSYTAPLVNFLSTQEHTNECRAVGFCMMCELQRHVLRSFNHHQNESIKPLAIIQKLRCIAKHLRFGHQEDAHEFLRYVIDGMQKSCLHGYEKLDKASKETTVIHEIFSGYYRSQVRCLMCHNTSNTFDPLMEVMLDIKQSPTIVRALQRLCKAELLDGDNLYYCLKCKKKVPAHKQVLIHQTPNILTVQLKRFDSNHIFGGKVTKPVDYKEYLDLRPFMTTPKGPPVKYKLYAVLVHSGYSSNSGHYYCYVRSSNNSWYNMNDSTVRQVGLNAALSQQAYLLFYSKVCDNTSPQEKKPFSPISIKPSNNSPAQHLPKIIKENDFGTPVSRNGLQQSKSPTSNTFTATKTKPTTPSHPSPSIIPADRPKLSFTLKSPNKFGKIKIEQKTPQEVQTKDESTKKHSVKQPTTTEKNDAPEKSDSKLEKPAKISAKSETEGTSTNSQDLKPPEPVEVSFPVKKDEKRPSPSKSVRPPPLFIPRIVQAKSSSNDAKSDGEKEVSMTSPAQATTPWKITPTPQFSMMSPPPKGAPLPQPSPSSVVSDGSSTSSVTAKTGEWAVKDKNVPTPGPILPERQHAGWTVSEKSGTETTDNNEEDWVEVTNDTNKKSLKKRKKQKKETMNYDKLDESTTSEAAENNVEEDKKDDSKKNKNQRKQKKKKKRKEKKKKDSEREELLKRKSSEEDLSSSEDKPQKRKKEDGDQEVNFKKQRLVEYSSNDSSGDDHNNNRKQKNHKHSENHKEPSKNNKKAVPVVVFDGNPQDKQSRKATWDGSRDSSTVNKLLNSGGGVFGYGSNVSTWEGGDSMVNDVTDKNDRKRKVSRDSWDEELDKGKVKKVKDKSKQEKFSSGANFFQREQDKRNKKGSVVDKFTSHFSRRQSSHHSRSHTGRPYRRF